MCSQLAGSCIGIADRHKEELLARLLLVKRSHEQRRRAAAAGDLPQVEAVAWAAEEEAVADGLVQGRQVLLAAGKEVMVFRWVAGEVSIMVVGVCMAGKETVAATAACGSKCRQAAACPETACA